MLLMDRRNIEYAINYNDDTPGFSLDTFPSIGSNCRSRASREAAGVARAAGGGALQAVRAPLTPRPRGTVYEALPFELERFLRRFMMKLLLLC